MLRAVPHHLELNHAVIYALVRMVTTGWVELLILFGNGAGLGATKIARGMFESAVMAEYLRQVPEEIDDYIEYGHISMYKRMKQYPGTAPEELASEISREYERVKPRFLSEKGKLRNSWNRYPISFMAEKIGRRDQYELPYSIAASVHHGNFEALVAHLREGSTALDIESPPSLKWTDKALLSGNTYLHQALVTLNESLKLGFEGTLSRASEDFARVWAKPRI